MEAYRLRSARAEDVTAMLSIYAPYVTDTIISFETEVPAPAEFAARVASVLAGLPWLVAEAEDGRIAGYAYAAPHARRAAYQWSVDVSVYLDPDHRGKGLGKKLYSRLFEILTELGYCRAYAGISLPNPASVGLHEALGFEPVGVYKRVGYKFGAWHDVGWWQLSLREDANPEAPRRFSELPADAF